MPTFNTPLLQEAYEKYALSIKKEKQKKRFEEVFRDSSSLEDLIKYTEKAKEADKKKRSSRVLNKLDKLLGFIRQNSGVLETLSQITSLIGCSIWAPLKLIVNVISESRAAIEKVTRMMDRLTNNAKFCKKYQELYGADTFVQDSLKSFYHDVIHFCAVAVRNFELSNWRKTLRPLYRSVTADFDAIIDDLEFHGKKVSEAATVVHMSKQKSFQTRVDQRYVQDKKEQIDKDRRKRESKARIWLNPRYYYFDQHIQQQRAKTKDTGKWFVEHTLFEKWKTGDKTPLLWVHGKPGCGKSYLASTAIQHLQDNNHQPIYYFYNQKETREEFHQGPMGFLAAFLFQLFETNSDAVRETIVTAWEQCPDKGRVQSFDYLKQILAECIPKITGDVVCVLDALDECKDSQLLIDCLLKTTKETDKIKFCITSRDEADMRKNFEPLCVKDGKGFELGIENSNVEADIKTFFDGKVQEWAPDKQQASGIESQIDDLVLRAEGMFLWARLMMDILDDTDSPKEIKNVLSNTPKALDGMYELIFSRIVNTCKGDESKLRCSQNIFKWATCATRALTVEELRVALAINKGDTDFQEENLIFESSFKDRIRIATGQLVEITPNGTIQVAHLTLKEFLFKECPGDAVYKDWIFERDTVHADLAEVTLTIMSFERFSFDYTSRMLLRDYEEDKAPDAFLGYAAQSWPHHCTMIGEDHKERGRDIYEKIKLFVQTEQSSMWYLIACADGSENLSEIEENLTDWGEEILGFETTIFENIFNEILLRQYDYFTSKGATSDYAIVIYLMVADLRIDDHRYEEAERLLLKTLDICAKLNPDPKDDMTCSVLSQLARLMKRLNRYEEAEQLQLRILEMQKSVGGEGSEIDAISTMATLALTYKKQNRHKEADELHKKTIEMVREKLLTGSKDPDLAGTCAFIAGSCLIKNEYRQGTELYEISMNIYMESYGIDNFETQWAMKKLSNTYSELGPEYFDKREKLDKRILALLKERYGPNHRKTVEYVETLADTFHDIGEWYRDHPESVKEKGLEIEYLLELTELRREVSEKYKRIFGETSEYTLTALTHLARSYRMLGWYYQRHENTGTLCQMLLKTEDILLDVLKQRQELLGDEDENTLIVMDYLSSTYKVGSEWDAVEELQRWCLKIRTRDLGIDNKSTRWSRDHLVEALQSLNKGDEAHDVLRRHTRLDMEWRRGTTVGQGSCSIRIDM